MNKRERESEKENFHAKERKNLEKKEERGKKRDYICLCCVVLLLFQ